MNIKMTWVVTGAILLLTGPVLGGDDAHHDKRSHAGGRSMHGMPDVARMVRHISHRLELDEAQSEELKNVVLSAKPQLAALRKKSRANREAIAALDLNSSDYAANIQSLAVDSGEIATEMTLLLSQIRLDIHSRLTPEQQQKLADTTDHMRHQWRENGHRGHPAHDAGHEQ